MSVIIDQSVLKQSTTAIRLVQGDTKNPLIVNLREQTINPITGLTVDSVIDVSTAVVRLKLRKVGTSVLIDTVTGTLLAGLESVTGVDITAPYNIPGRGGRVAFFWNVLSLSQSGDVEGEIEITFADQTVQTVYTPLKFKIRAQF